MGSSSSKPQTRFESLNDDTLTTVLEFVGRRSYRSFGGLNKQCRKVYLSTEGMTKETFLYGYAPLWAIKVRIERDGEWRVRCGVGKGVVHHNRRDVLDLALKKQKKDVLQQICNGSAEEGRIDLLDYVWNNVYDRDDQEYIFRGGDGYAAIHGKLNVFKWLETKRVSINIQYCAEEAAHAGHIHILKWLKEEKGLGLDEGLYRWAIYGGHLHVMKWLREQEAPLTGYTFFRAAENGNPNILQWLHDEGCPRPGVADDERQLVCAAIEGNLNILQWLHDEGCPWYENYLVSERSLKPEVIDWLRSNGYGDRIQFN